MFTGFFGFVQLVAIYSPLIPLFFILLFWKKLSKNPLAKALLILLCLDFFTDIFSQIVIVWNHWHETTNDIQQVYTFLFCFAAYNVFRQGISNPKALRIITIAYGTVALFQLYFLITDFGLQNTFVHPSSFLTVLNIFVSIYYFYETFTEMKIKSLSKDPFFWVNTAMFLYVGGGFILQLFQNTLNHIAPNISNILWPIFNISTILFNVLILKAIWLMKKA